MTNINTTVFICNFNTTALTDACIKSIFQNFTSNPFKVVVLDNSDICPYQTTLPNKFQIIDNTTQKYIDFDAIIKQFAKVSSANNYASLKHCVSIQFLLNICTTRYAMLFDSDTKLLRDIDFISDEIISAFDIHNNGSKLRALPYIQFFNIDMFKSSKIKYFDPNRMHGGSNLIASHKYDTGASFFEDIKKMHLPYRQINYSNYIWHKKRGSW